MSSDTFFPLASPTSISTPSPHWGFNVKQQVKVAEAVKLEVGDVALVPEREYALTREARQQ